MLCVFTIKYAMLKFNMELYSKFSRLFHREEATRVAARSTEERLLEAEHRVEAARADARTQERRAEKLVVQLADTQKVSLTRAHCFQ